MRVLVLGLGYVGSPLASELARRGHEVFGLQRSPVTHDSVRTLAGDITNRESLAKLPRDWDWVVNTVSSSKGGADEYRAVYLEGTRNLIELLRVRRYVFTSSTSVYGQTDGSVVDEQSPTQPASVTSKILVEAEQLLLRASRERDFPAIILRVAGIYGRGRGYLFQQYLKGEAVIPGQGERMINMAHRDDVVGAIIAVLERGQPEEIYNVADNEPVSHRDFFQWLSEKMNRPLPPFTAQENLARKRGVTNKRVSNGKLRALGYTFAYPTFREGYAPEIQAASTC